MGGGSLNEFLFSRKTHNHANVCRTFVMNINANDKTAPKSRQLSQLINVDPHQLSNEQQTMLCTAKLTIHLSLESMPSAYQPTNRPIGKDRQFNNNNTNRNSNHRNEASNRTTPKV